jgi:hypothetical protein
MKSYVVAKSDYLIVFIHYFLVPPKRQPPHQTEMQALQSATRQKYNPEWTAVAMPLEPCSVHRYAASTDMEPRPCSVSLDRLNLD